MDPQHSLLEKCRHQVNTVLKHPTQVPASPIKIEVEETETHYLYESVNLLIQEYQNQGYRVEKTFRYAENGELICRLSLTLM